jgi:hypothetical protein
MKPERRQATRTRLYQSASIVFNGRQSMFGCSVRNQSETGALLRMTDWIALPATFEIETAGETESRRVRQCWRRGDDVGVAFLSAQECRPDAPLDLAAFRARRAGRSGV